MANLKDVIYLSNADYSTLVTTGSVTISGTTLTYDENSIYITPEEVATTTKDGLMSASDKATFDTIASTYASTGDIKNGTLYLLLNGATATTFTANQAGSSSFNVTLPTGAMTFVGSSSTDPKVSGATVSGHTSWAKGDVVIYKRDTETGYEEYINLDGNNASTSWELLGDADDYALKTITVSGTNGLTGSGTLASNISISHATGTNLTTQAVYTFTTDTYGHIASASAATYSDVGAASAAHSHSSYQASGNYVTYTQNNSVPVMGTNKTTYTYGQTPMVVDGGIIIGGTAAAAGLVTRGISGVTTPTSSGSCTKENLYINYDSTNTYSATRQLVLQAGQVGSHYGSNLYQYAAVRGDVAKAWLDTKASTGHGHSIIVDASASALTSVDASETFTALKTMSFSSDTFLTGINGGTGSFSATTKYIIPTDATVASSTHTHNLTAAGSVTITSSDTSATGKVQVITAQGTITGASYTPSGTITVNRTTSGSGRTARRPLTWSFSGTVATITPTLSAATTTWIGATFSGQSATTSSISGTESVLKSIASSDSSTNAVVTYISSATHSHTAASVTGSASALTGVSASTSDTAIKSLTTSEDTFLKTVSVGSAT